MLKALIKSVYNSKTQSNSSKIIEKLGTEKELRGKLNGQDPYEWDKKYIEELNKKEKEENRQFIIKRTPSKLINQETI